MKKMIFAAILAVSAVSFANDGAGIGTEEVIAAGGLTTIVGGCADAKLVQNGENSEIVYTEPCQTAPTAALSNDHTSIFATVEQASAACQRISSGYVQAVYTWGFKIVGYQCAPLNDFNGGN